MKKEKAINMDEVWHAKRIRKSEFGGYDLLDYIEISGRRTLKSESNIIFRMKVKDFLSVIKLFKQDVRRARLKADKDLNEYQTAAE